MTIIFADAAADDLLAQQRTAAALDQSQIGAISSAPSTVKSSSGFSSSVVSVCETRRLCTRRLRGRHRDDIETGAHPLGKQVDKMLGGRAGAEPEPHARAHKIESAGGSREFVSVSVHRQRRPFGPS